MNNITQLTIILFVNIFCNIALAQVYTPNGTSVNYQIYTAGNIATFENQAANWLSARGWTNDVIKTAPATGVYNCHSYAWNMSEGGSSCWINAFINSEFNNFNPNNYNSTPPTPKNIQKYWDDNSYIEVSENEATKVWYGSCWTWSSYYGWENSCDHSAIRITSGINTGKYESKWGAWPRYIHPVNKSPYINSNRRFFKRGPYISGSSTVCFDSDFSLGIQNLPVSYSIVWTPGPNITHAHTYGNSARFNFKNSSSSGNYVNATVTFNNATYYLPRFNITGTNGMGGVSIDGPSYINTGSSSSTWASYSIGLSGDRAAVTDYSWNGFGQYKYSTNYNDYSFTVEVPYYSSGSTINCYVYDACGNSAPAWMDVVVGGYYYYAYPNPASNLLNVEVDQEAYTKSKSNGEKATGQKKLNTPVTFDIRLYDNFGNMLRRKTSKGEKVEFDVSALTSGIYFLHIYDGSSDKPDVKQIVVEH